MSSLPFSYLVTSTTLAGGVRMACIGRTTLYRWMNDHDFRATPQRLRDEAAERVKGKAGLVAADLPPPRSLTSA